MGVKIVWLADENFAASREVTIEVLQQLIAADLGLSLNINMTAATSCATPIFSISTRPPAWITWSWASRRSTTR